MYDIIALIVSLICFPLSMGFIGIAIGLFLGLRDKGDDKNGKK